MSVDEFYIRLMNEEIDGVISGGDADRLAELIRTDPEAARYFEELKAAVGALDDSPDLEPPSELRARIFDSVYGSSKHEAARPAGGRGFWRSFVPVFAAGVAAGFILFAIVRPVTERFTGTSDYGATIGAAQDDNAAAERFDAFGVKGGIVPVFESGSITLTLELASETDVSVLVEFGEDVSFESIRSNEGAAYQMEVAQTSLLLVHDGEAEYIIRMRSTETGAVVIRIFTDGKTVAAMKFAAG
jgi:hypothetical protein